MKIKYEIKLAGMKARDRIKFIRDLQRKRMTGYELSQPKRHCLGYTIVRNDGKELRSTMGTFTDFVNDSSLWIETKKEALEVLNNLARTHTHHGMFQADDTIEGTPHYLLNEGNLIC